jgi:hypothetical protein
MDEGRERREAGTADAEFIPEIARERLGGDGTALDRVMAELADECATAGDHQWLDPDTRTLCTHCGAAWGPRSN